VLFQSIDWDVLGSAPANSSNDTVITADKYFTRQQVPSSLPNHLDPQLFSHSQTLFSLLNPPRNHADQPPQLQHTTIQPPFMHGPSQPASPHPGATSYAQDYRPWDAAVPTADDMDAEGSPVSEMAYSQASTFLPDPSQEDVQSEARRFSTAMPGAYREFYPGQAIRPDVKPSADEPSVALGSWDPNLSPALQQQQSPHQRQRHQQGPPWGGR